MSTYCQFFHCHSFVTLHFAQIAPKKSPSASAKRHVIMLDNKLMIKRLEKGEKVITIARSFEMIWTTILISLSFGRNDKIPIFLVFKKYLFMKKFWRCTYLWATLYIYIYIYIYICVCVCVCVYLWKTLNLNLSVRSLPVLICQYGPCQS